LSDQITLVVLVVLSLKHHTLLRAMTIVMMRRRRIVRQPQHLELALSHLEEEF